MKHPVEISLKRVSPAEICTIEYFVRIYFKYLSTMRAFCWNSVAIRVPHVSNSVTAPTVTWSVSTVRENACRDKRSTPEHRITGTWQCYSPA